MSPLFSFSLQLLVSNRIATHRTCVISFILYFTITDFPEDAKWLSSAERNYVAARLRVDSGRSAVERKINLKDIANVFKDFKVVLAGLMYFGKMHPHQQPVRELLMTFGRPNRARLRVCVLLSNHHKRLR